MWFRIGFLAMAAANAAVVLPVSAAEIHEASTAGRLAAVRDMLAENPGLLEMPDENRNLPLHLAAQGGHVALVEFLLDKGAAVDAGDRENTTALAVAASRGHLAVVDLLLARGADAERADDNGVTALHFASGGGHLEVVRRLIEEKANPDAVSVPGHTPLHWAAATGHVAVAKALIEAGAGLRRRDQWGNDPLTLAAMQGRREMVEFLIDTQPDLVASTGDFPTPLHHALRLGHAEIVSLLIDRGADINATVDGETPLHWAIGGRQAEIVRRLIAAGANVNVRDRQQVTPLHLTTWNDSAELAAVILEAGAEVDALDANGVTPLLVALQHGHREMVELLLKHGASPDRPESHYGLTPLHIAAIQGSADIVELLLADSPEIDVRDNEGCTPLCYAGKYGHEKVFKALLAKGADPDAASERAFGFSPLLSGDLQQGQAVIWHLGHSGWALRTQNHLLIFDYFFAPGEPTEPRLANGHILPEEIADQNVYVFATHEHRDHYDPRIFQWADEVKDITYVIGCSLQDVPEHIEVGPHEDRLIDDLEVRTIESTDGGVAFLVKVDGLCVFHAGDHASWNEESTVAYNREIDLLAAANEAVDLAFFPIHGCGAHDDVIVPRGVFYAIDRLKPTVVFPMHRESEPWRYTQFAQMAADRGCPAKVQVALRRGDRFFFEKEGARP